MARDRNIHVSDRTIKRLIIAQVLPNLFLGCFFSKCETKAHYMITSRVSKFIKKYFYMLALAGMAIGFSAFKVESHRPVASFIYEVAPDGTLGSLIDENEADCNLPSGEPCSVELSAPKPTPMQTISDAESSSIWVQTFHRD